MLQRRAELSLLRALCILLVGVLAGMQIALYLFDLYDDGVAERLSAVIGVALLILGVMLVLWFFRKRST